MVGSSWNAADSSGEAPIRSPAATVTDVLPLRPCAAVRSCLRWVARYSAPPAGVPLMLPDELVGGVRRQVAVEVVEREQLDRVWVGLGFAAR